MDISIKADSSKIELAVHGLIETPLVGVCDFVKAGSRNSSKNPDTSVYCNATVPILDLSAISQTTIRIEIYAKDIDGFKNSTKLSAIRDVIMSTIKDGVTIDDSYFVTLNNEFSRTDGAGFHFVFLNMNVIII